MSNLKAMVNMGNNVISIDINDFKRINDYQTVLTLVDETKLYSYPSDVTLYSGNTSSTMKMEELMNPTYLYYNGPEISKPKLDSALITMGDKQTVVKDLSGVRFKDSSYTVLTFKDGGEVGIHPKDLKLFDSDSEVMQLYQDRFIPEKEDLTEEDIDDYIFNMI